MSEPKKDTKLAIGGIFVVVTFFGAWLPFSNLGEVLFPSGLDERGGLLVVLVAWASGFVAHKTLSRS
jgi:hypothetical protein